VHSTSPPWWVTWISQDGLKTSTRPRLAACQPPQVHCPGIFHRFPLSRATGNPKPLALSPRPLRGEHSPPRDREEEGPPVSVRYLSPCSSAQPQRFQAVWGAGWPLAVQFSRRSWPLTKRCGLASTFTHGTSARGWRRAQHPGAIRLPPTGQGIAWARVPRRAEPTLDEEPQGGGGRAVGAACHALVQPPVPRLHAADLQRAVLQQPGPAVPRPRRLPVPAPRQVVGHVAENRAGHDHVLAR